jgi:hypothetical protein
MSDKWVFVRAHRIICIKRFYRYAITYLFWKWVWECNEQKGCVEMNVIFLCGLHSIIVVQPWLFQCREIGGFCVILLSWPSNSDSSLSTPAKLPTLRRKLLSPIKPVNTSENWIPTSSSALPVSFSLNPARIQKSSFPSSTPTVTFSLLFAQMVFSFFFLQGPPHFPTVKALIYQTDRVSYRETVFDWSGGSLCRYMAVFALKRSSNSSAWNWKDASVEKFGDSDGMS